MGLAKRLFNKQKGDSDSPLASEAGIGADSARVDPEAGGATTAKKKLGGATTKKNPAGGSKVDSDRLDGGAAAKEESDSATSGKKATVETGTTDATSKPPEGIGKGNWHISLLISW